MLGLIYLSYQIKLYIPVVSEVKYWDLTTVSKEINFSATAIHNRV